MASNSCLPVITLRLASACCHPPPSLSNPLSVTVPQISSIWCQSVHSTTICGLFPLLTCRPKKVSVLLTIWLWCCKRMCGLRLSSLSGPVVGHTANQKSVVLTGFWPMRSQKGHWLLALLFRLVLEDSGFGFKTNFGTR